MRYFAENNKFYLFIWKAFVDRGEYNQKHKQSCSLYISGYKILFMQSNNVYFSLFHLPDFMYLFTHENNHCIFNYL